MNSTGRSGDQAETRAGLFSTTHWSVVLAVGQEDSTRAMAALEQLCRTYRYPIYAYLRRRGFTEPDAQDFTQGFFALLLKRRALEKVVPGKGRFRSYLLSALNHFLSDERERQQAQKRGSGQPVISLDAQEAEQRYRVEPLDTETPEKLFERTWAMTLIDRTMSRLRREFAQDGKGAFFEELGGFIVEGAKDRHYGEAAAQLGISEEAVRKTVQRLRLRFRTVLREEIAKTVTKKSEIDEELRHMVAALSP